MQRAKRVLGYCKWSTYPQSHNAVLLAFTRLCTECLTLDGCCERLRTHLHRTIPPSTPPPLKGVPWTRCAVIGSYTGTAARQAWRPCTIHNPTPFQRGSHYLTFVLLTNGKTTHILQALANLALSNTRQRSQIRRAMPTAGRRMHICSSRYCRAVLQENVVYMDGEQL